jgi:hypothetical protein
MTNNNQSLLLIRQCLLTDKYTNAETTSLSTNLMENKYESNRP